MANLYTAMPLIIFVDPVPFTSWDTSGNSVAFCFSGTIDIMLGVSFLAAGGDGGGNSS